MNIGGDPGQDDYGLPPVDVEIPDDARDLDRDVHEYHRELRAQRRRLLLGRLGRALARDGMVMPLLAGCLALTLLAGTLLTVLRDGPPAPTGQRASAPSGAGRSPAPGQPGGPLPDIVVMKGGVLVPLRTLSASVLALVPANCRCVPLLRSLIGQASGVNAPVYVVGLHRTPVAALTAQAGLRPTQAVEDIGNLTDYYHPAVLTAVLVRPDGTVAAILPVPGHGAAIERALKSLTAVG